MLKLDSIVIHTNLQNPFQQKTVKIDVICQALPALYFFYFGLRINRLNKQRFA